MTDEEKRKALKAGKEELRGDLLGAVLELDFDAIDLDGKEARKVSKLGALYRAVEAVSDAFPSPAEELADARKYYALCEATGDPDYRKLAEDEERHSAILMEKMQGARKEEKVSAETHKS